MKVSSESMRVLIVGASPDSVNRNAVMRSYVREGFEELLGSPQVFESPLESSPCMVETVRPDLVICFGSCMPDVIDYGALRDVCDRHNVGIAFWLHDDPYEFDVGYKAEQISDWIFSNDRWSSIHYSHPKVFHLPMAASATVHFQEWRSTKENDVFFCGVAFENRVRIIQDLTPRLANVRTCILGDEWPASISIAENRRMTNSELSREYANSWITMNIGRTANLANQRFQLDASTPGPRTFEAAMAGTVQFYFADSLEVTDYFAPGSEIVLFDDPQSFAESLREILENKKLAARIAKAARERVLAEHTYKHRVSELLLKCGY